MAQIAWAIAVLTKIYYGILNVVVTHFLFYIGNQLEATILPGIRAHLFHKSISSSDFF